MHRSPGIPLLAFLLCLLATAQFAVAAEEAPTIGSAEVPVPATAGLPSPAPAIVESTLAEVESTLPAVTPPVTAAPAGGAPAATATADAALAARLQVVETMVRDQQKVIGLQQRQIDELKAQSDKSVGSVNAFETRLAQTEKQKKLELPGWLDGLKFSGDLRLRYEGTWFDPRTPVTDDTQHGRFRLRFGFTKRVTDEFDLGFRLASGSDNGATSTEQTLTGDFSKKPVWIDLAYMTYHPTALPGFEVGAGKFKNPYVNTDMVWDSDVNPEGAYETYKVALGEHFEPFMTLGQNSLNENTSASDAWLLAYQPGVNVIFTRDVVWTSALAYYDYMDYTKAGNWARAAGNTLGPNGTLAAGEFNVWNFTNIVTFKVAHLTLSPYFDYAKNADDQAIVNGSRQDTAWSTGFKVGDVKTKGDWAIDYKYARIEADSVVGGFNDSSFGGVNVKGSKLGFAYGIAKNVTIATAWYFTKPVTGTNVDRTLAQVDLLFKF